MKTDQTTHLMHMMMKSKTFSITRWTMLFAFVLAFSQLSLAQTLTISDGGQTGTSGTNWSVSGTNPITISATGGNAEVNSSVVEGYLNAGTSVLLEGVVVSVNNPLEKTAGGDASLTLRAGGTNTNSHGRLLLFSNITSSSGALDLVLWSDYNHHNKGGVSVFSNNIINTNGGHFWAGGSSTAQGSTTWNGLTVGDGPAVGSIGNNFNAFDFYDVDLNTGGGDVFLWAGQGYGGGANGISFNGSTGEINSGTGDVTFISDAFLGETTITSTGHLYLAPHDGAYPGAVNWSHNNGSPNINVGGTFDALNINDFNNLGGLTIGEYEGMSGVDYSNTSVTTINSTINVAGPISIYGNQIIMNESLETTASEAGILVKSNGGIEFSADGSIVTNNGDIIVWSDSDADQEGHITIGNNVTFNSANGSTTSGLSGGGHIVLAGGLDEGANDGTENDGIPDGYARSASNPGIALNSDNTGDVSFYSGGGDVIMRAYSSNNSGTAAENNGINQYGGLLINSGTGQISMLGEGVNQYGINLNQASANDVLQLELISAANAGNAISIRGVSGSDIGLVFNFSSLKELTATDGGNILLEGLAGGTSPGIFLQTLSVLANSGTITLDGGVNGIFNKSTGNTYGAKAGTAIEASSSNIIFRGNSISVEAGGTATSFNTSGTVTLEPSGNDFSNPLTFPIPNLTLDNAVSGLTIGKETSSADGTSDADVTIAQATSIAGPISIYGGDINIDANLSSAATSGNGVLIHGQRILQDNGIDVSTSGANIEYEAANFEATAGSEQLISLLGTGVDKAVLNANGGNITLNSSFGTGGVQGGSDRAIQTNNAEINTSGTGLISLLGDATANPNTGTSAWGTQFYASKIQSADGDITLDMTGGASASNSRGFVVDGNSLSVLSNSGTIRIVDREPTGLTGGYTGLYLRPSSANAIAIGADGTSVLNSSSDILIESDKITFDGIASNINSSGVISIRPLSESFANTLSTSLVNIQASASGLNLGKAGNTGNITHGAATSIAGPIHIYGGDIAINGALSSSSDDITIVSNGTVSQSAALTANGLSLNGTGDFVLNNASNNVLSIAGGDDDTALGNVAYRDADALALGTVGSQSGIIAAGTIQVETENGDLSLSQNINTSSSANNAIVLNAGRAAEVGTETGGDIIVSGSPTLTTGAGGISKLFSGTDANSTGLTTLVGDSNVRYDLDETSDLSGEGLVADNAYAIYRSVGNTPPTVTSTSITTATAESLYTYNIEASDAENDLITWTENTIPDWLTFSSGTLQTSFVGTGSNPANTGDGVNQSEDGTSASSAFILTGSAAHGDGKLFFTDTEEYGIRYVDADGNVQTWFQGDGEYTTLNPVGIAFDALNDAVYVGDYASTDILKIDDSGTLSLLSDLPEPFMLRLLVNSDGSKLYASARGGIYEIDLANSDPADNWTRVVGTGTMGYSDTGFASTSQVSQPHGMAFDNAGRLVFTDRFNDIIRRVDLTTNSIETIAGTQGAGAEAGDGGPAVDATFADPSGLVINQQGEIFISERLSKRIRKIDTNGDIDTYFTVAAGGFADDLVISDGGELFLLTTNLIAQVATVAELSGTPTNADAGVHDVSLTLSDGEFDVPYNFQITVIAINNAPSDIALDNNTINQSATGVDAAVGNLSTTDEDAGDTHTYTLVAGAGDTHNASFNIDASSLRTSSALSPGTYSVRINTNDGSEDFSKAFSIIVNDDVAPNPPSLPDLSDASDTCESNDDNITTVTTPTFTGTAEANATIDLSSSIDGSIGNVSADGTGNWSITSTSLSLGTHSITATATDAAANTSSTSIGLSLTITTLDDASFGYASSAYCVDASDPNPTVTGASGGDFTSTSGLSINASTGAIDVSASTPGTYSVTYTTAGACPNSSSVSVTINALDDASFNYSAAAYCVDESDPTPSITGIEGGTFSSAPAGLSLNASTGDIDVSASTPGEYTVTYTTAGACPNSSSVSVTINALDDASFNYSAAAYCMDASDPTPTVTGWAGGAFSSTLGLELDPNTGAIDVSSSTPGTYTVTYTTAGECPNSSNASVTINALDDAAFNYSAAAYCVNASDPTPTITGLAGGTFSSALVLELDPITGTIDVSASTPGTYTVSYTTTGTCPNTFDVNVTINALDDASFAYSAAAYCEDATDPTPSITGLVGGTFSSTLGLDINPNTGAIDVSSSTPGTYTVSYTTNGTCANSSEETVTINKLDDALFEYSSAAYCEDALDPTPTIIGVAGGTFSSVLGLVLDPSTGAIDVSASIPGEYTVTYTTASVCPNSSEENVIINVLDDASFNYPAAAYCEDASDPTPTITGTEGGTFSSASGLDLNPITGAIDVSVSIPGEYLVTYTTDGVCANSSSVSVSIHALDDASFAYSATTYCANSSDPTPTITGSAGGTFSSTPGLELDPSTGVIDLSASTSGVYTIMYTTNGACPESSSANVTIHALNDASFAYDNNTYDVTASDPMPTVMGDAGGVFTSSVGLSINSNTGLIDVSESDLGTYVITYTISRPCISSSTFEVTITNTSNVEETSLDLSSLSLYPNPASSVVHINNPNQIALQSISIYDLHGRLVQEVLLENNVFNPSIDVGLFESAFYLIKMTTEDSREITVRFTKL